jgi:4-amino-4-deoxy-L-arabinose transferase-like glycosyltransferase
MFETSGVARRSVLRSNTPILAYIALADFIFHMLIAGNYGYFRDELYYIVAGQHLAFGYVDFPPAIAVLAALMNFIAKDSLVSIHVIPALAASLTVFLAGKIAQEFGGGAKAQVLAAVATMFSASFAVASLFTPDALDMLWWTLLAYLLVLIIKRDNKDRKLWILFGAIAGIGLMTKLTMAFFLLAVLVGFLATKKRTYLKSHWPWLGAAIAFAIVSPYLAWNYSNGWQTVDFYFHHGGLNGSGPISFLAYQILIAGLLGLPLVVVGFYFYFRSSFGRRYSILALVFLILLIVFTATNAKPYFIMGGYPFMFAGAGIVIERARNRLVWPAYLTGIIVIGIALAPLYAPVLPPQTYAQNYGGLTGAANGAAAQSNAGVFPQYLGDRFGWDTMTATVAQVYYSLNSSARTAACIFASNYGEASALIVLGKNYDLPPVISAHNNFYLWGPGSCSGSVLIMVGVNQTSIQGYFNSVSVVATITCSYCMTTEDNLPVLLGLGLREPLQAIWPLLKDYS